MLISLPHMVPEVSLIEKTNTFLPDQIRLMGLKRVTRGFNSKGMCGARTYEYLLPTYAFAPFRLTTLDYRIDGRPYSLVDPHYALHVAIVFMLGGHPTCHSYPSPLPSSLPPSLHTDDTLSRVKSLLQQYVGTHNFHNFTSRRY